MALGDRRQRRQAQQAPAPQAPQKVPLRRPVPPGVSRIGVQARGTRTMAPGQAMGSPAMGQPRTPDLQRIQAQMAAQQARGPQQYEERQRMQAANTAALPVPQGQPQRERLPGMGPSTGPKRRRPGDRPTGIGSAAMGAFQKGAV